MHRVGICIDRHVGLDFGDEVGFFLEKWEDDVIHSHMVGIVCAADLSKRGLLRKRCARSSFRLSFRFRWGCT